MEESFGLSIRDEVSASSQSDADFYLRLHESLADGNRLTQLVTAASPARLAAAIATEKNITLRKRFLQGSADMAAPAALLKLTTSAAEAYAQPLSAPLNSLLNKLALEAAELPDDIRAQADRAFRDLVKHIAESWSVGALDTSASTFESLFQEEGEAEVAGGSAAPDATRVLQMAFESGALGPLVWTAVAKLGDADGVRELLGMLKRAPAGSRSAEAIAQQFANPMRLTMLLHEDPVDFEIVDALLARMGPGAATAMIDGIAESKTRETRRGLLDRIVALGPSVEGYVAERLKSDERWFVQRNMLTILREANIGAGKVQLEKFLHHTDPRVRREAIQLQFSDPGTRDRSIVSALKETDSQIVKVALQAARSGLPEAAVPVLAKRVVETDFPPEYRAAALQLLGRSTSMLALEALLRFAMGGTTLLGRPKLAPKSHEMLIALSGLARAWPNDRRVAPLLAAARDSKDRDIAGAATPARTATPSGDLKDALDDLG